MSKSTHQKKKCKQKNSDKDGKALHKLMSNAVYGKTMVKLRNRIDAKLENQNQATYHKNYLTIL